MNTHEQIKELLTDYALRELPEQKSSEVKQHLADCQQCRTELKKLQAVLECADSMSELSVDEQIIESAKESLLTAVAKEETKQPTPRPTIRLDFIWSNIMKNRIAKLAAAAVLVVAVLIGIHSLTGGTVTFAQVIEPILNARTVVYDFIIGDEESNPVIMHEIVVGTQIRRTISNIPGMTQIIDLENGKMLVLLEAEEKTAAYVNIKGALQERTKCYIGFVRKVLMELKDSPDVKELGEQEIDGRKAIGFSGRGNNNQELKIWADPKTAVPIRVELRLGQLLVVMKNFKFDEPIDDSQISMDVPKGYTLEEAEIDFTKGTEEDFIESLRIWAEILLDGTFPEAVGTESFMKQMPLLGEKIAQSGLSEDEAAKLGAKLGMTLPRGMFFLQLLETEDKYHYAGKGVKLGDADKAIFWYRPEGSDTYRVIYGDLSVKDVSEENLPK